MPPKPLKLSPTAKELSELLSELAGVQDGKLKKTVEQSEGLKSPVETVHGTRKMQCYSVTESELMQLSLVNTLVAFAWSLVSGIGIFLIDILKDIVLSEDIPATAQSIGIYIVPALLFIILLAVFGVFKARAWRKRLIDLIKEESGNGHLPTQDGRLRLQWPLTRSIEKKH